MRAIWLEDQRVRLREDVPVPTPPEGEALVRVLKAGICNTDLELIRGYYPFRGILGHEFVGVVTVGATHLVGRRVVGEINAVCGECRPCRRGDRSHCMHRTVLGIVNRDGAFADHLVLPVENLHVVPDDVPTEVAVFTEPLAAALEIQQQVAVGRGTNVMVVGDGKLGNLIAQTLALADCDVIVAGHHDHKLAVIAACGIATTRPDEIESGAFDVAVECTGNEGGFETALRAVRPRGTLVMKSTYAGSLAVDAAAIVVNEVTVVGSRCGPFEPALDLLARRRVSVEPLIHARHPLEAGVTALAQASESGVLKVVLDVS